MACYVMCDECTAFWQQDAAAEKDRRERGKMELEDGVVEKLARGCARKQMICDGLCARVLPTGANCWAITVIPPGSSQNEDWVRELVRVDPVWWWLSFADPTKPRGEQWFGAVLVGPDVRFLDAVLHAHRLQINPGGEVLAQPYDDIDKVPESFRLRLLNKADVEELSRLGGGPGEVERMP